MKKVLHLLTSPADDFTEVLIAAQKAELGNEVKTVDLAGDTPDYAEVVNLIFAADSIQTW